MKKFDFTIPPKKVKWYLKPIINLLVNLSIKKFKPEITYINTENIKAPFLLLCNHNAFLDFKVAEYVLKDNEANYVVAIDGYLNRKKLLQNVGCICKRKFTTDVSLIRNLKKSISMGNVAAIYPEARYSLCGTTALLPKSLGKLAKLLDVPVITLICHGHHINSPFWDTSHERGVRPQETYKLLLTQEEVRNLSVEEINNKIVNEFQYDEFKWQLENKVKVVDKKRAEGLHRVLYKCPICGDEHHMTSKGSKLECAKCGTVWEMNEYGQLICDKKTFSHIPDWYEWERECVRKEVLDGTYTSNELDCTVDSIPDAKFIHLGKGKMIHDMNGFKLYTKDYDGNDLIVERKIPEMYSLHIEYQYLFKHGDCVDLNTENDTYYIYPEGEFNVTKMALATEELYFNEMRKLGIKFPKGLA